MLKLDEIYEGDCLEIMKGMPEKSVGLIMTDPPYLMNYRSNRRTKTEKFRHIENDVDSHQLISDYFAECHRILNDNSAIYSFCSWHNVDFFKTEFEKHFKLKNIIVWNKNNHGSGDLKGAYAPKHEFILYGHKGRSLFREKRIPDVLDFPKVSSAKMTHPTEKPVGLLEILIKNNSDVGDVVFDGFAGTASTLIAAKKNNRNFIGIEMDSEYCNIARARISEAKGALV